MSESRKHPSLELCVQFSDDGQHIRKWSRLPFDGGTNLYSHPTTQPESVEAAVERVTYAIILGSSGERAADHAKEFQTANWEDARRSAIAVINAMLAEYKRQKAEWVCEQRRAAALTGAK